VIADVRWASNKHHFLVSWLIFTARFYHHSHVMFLQIFAHDREKQLIIHNYNTFPTRHDDEHAIEASSWLFLQIFVPKEAGDQETDHGVVGK
jgi:hypothetical protein